MRRKVILELTLCTLLFTVSNYADNEIAEGTFTPTALATGGIGTQSFDPQEGSLYNPAILFGINRVGGMASYGFASGLRLMGHLSNDYIHFNTGVNDKSPIKDWKLSIKDRNGNIVREFKSDTREVEKSFIAVHDINLSSALNQDSI